MVMVGEMSEKQKHYLALAEEGERYRARISQVQPPEVVTLLNQETVQTLTVLEQIGNGGNPALRMSSSGETILDGAEAKVQLLKSALPQAEGGNPPELLAAVAGIHQQRYVEFQEQNQRCVDLGVTSDPYVTFKIPPGFMEKQAALANLNERQRRMCKAWTSYSIAWQSQEVSKKALQKLQHSES